jgi:polysaccharide export outer membrane protein
MIFRNRPALFILLVLLSISFICYAQPSKTKRILKGDRLTIKVLEQEDLNGAYTVYSDGVLEFPLIPKGIKAAGLTHEELATKIKEGLEEEYFYNATVIVTPYRKGDTSISRLKTKGGIVYVYGRVSREGVVKIPNDEVLTVSKVIIRSGGFKEFANRKKVKLIRRSAATGKSETTVLNMVNIIDKGQLEKDVPVQNGDIVVVPEQFFNF